MSRKRRYSQLYLCPRLQGYATLEIEVIEDAHVPDPQEHPEVFEWHEIYKRMPDCRNRHQCGIMEAVSSGHSRIHWELCPAAQKFKNES